MEHLPRLPVRHPVAPLLVLVRAEPELEPDLSAPARDPGVPPRLRREVRPAALHPIRRRKASARQWNAEDARWELETSSGNDDRARPDRRAGRPERAAAPGHSRPRHLRGPVVPLRAVGPLGRPRRQEGRRPRHGRVRDPDRPHHPARGRGAACLPAHAAVGRPPLGPADHRRRAAPLPPLPRAPARRAAQRLLAAGDARHSDDAPAECAEGARAARCRAHEEVDQGPRAAAQAHAGLPHRLQAHPAVEPVVSRARQAERQRRHRRHRRDQAGRASSRRTARCTSAT